MVMQALLGSADGGAIELKNRTSKLAIDLGEQGAAYDFSVFNVAYKDTGLFGVYLNCPDNKLEDGMWYTLHNLVRLAHKTTLKSQVLASIGTNSGVAADLAKSLTCY